MGALENYYANVVTKTVQCDEGKTWHFDYYLQTYTSSNNVELYGVKVCKRGNAIVVEEAETFAITDSRDKAETILKYLAAGTVPPCVLIEMVDEWFSNEVWSSGDFLEASQIPTWHTYHMGG